MLQSAAAPSVSTFLLLVPTILVTRHVVAVEVVVVEALIAAGVVEVGVVVGSTEGTVEVVVVVVEAQPIGGALVISKARR